MEKNEMETIIYENCKEEEEEDEEYKKTSESICNVSSSSSLTRPLPRYSSFHSPSFLPSYQHQTDKQQRSISDPRTSLRAFPSRINPTKKNSYRRSTVVCVPVSDNKQKEINNEILLRVPYKQIEDDYFPKRINDNSIAFIKENSSYPIDEPRQSLFDSDSDSLKYYKTGTTRIKLSLPVTSNQINSHYRYQNRLGGTENATGEFTLPTNPPITVTIEPQLNHYEKEKSLHDDQIFSNEQITMQDQRKSIDISLKGGSTIVNYFMDLLKPSDNKLAMKLFGSRKGVLKERLRQQRAGHCIIHPCSNFR
jgi:hypothetical protein